LKGFRIVEIVYVDDVDIGVKDFGTTDVVQVNLFFKVTFLEGLEASFELLLVVQEDLMVKVTLGESALVDGSDSWSTCVQLKQWHLGVEIM
jgi:hypothetical protein